MILIFIFSFVMFNASWTLSGKLLSESIKPFKREIFKLRGIFGVIDCLRTIYDTQDEKCCLNHCNEFLHILDFEILLWKTVGAILVFEILVNNV